MTSPSETENTFPLERNKLYILAERSKLSVTVSEGTELHFTGVISFMFDTGSLQIMQHDDTVTFFTSYHHFTLYRGE
jgi:hypothetical protein